MKVIVRDNQIEKAIKDLKRKLTKEGFFSEIKERRFYDKPSVQKKRNRLKLRKEDGKKLEDFSVLFMRISERCLAVKALILFCV